MKVDSLYEATPKQFSDLITPLKYPTATKAKKNLKLVDIKSPSQRHTQKMKVDSLYEAIPEQFFHPKQPKYSHKRLNMTLNWVNIDSASQGNALKMKIFYLDIETPKHFSDPNPPPKQPNTGQNAKMNIKIGLYKKCQLEVYSDNEN